VNAIVESLLIPIIIFFFSAVFWITSKDDRCWYRRYILPLMVLSLILVFPTVMGAAILLLSATFIYDGYRGYGRQVLSGSLVQSKKKNQ